MNLLGRGQQKTPQKRNPPITSPRVPFLHPRIPVDVLWFRVECTPLAGLTSKLDRLGSSSSIRSKPYICNCNFGTIHHLPLLPSVFVAIALAKKKKHRLLMISHKLSHMSASRQTTRCSCQPAFWETLECRLQGSIIKAQPRIRLKIWSKQAWKQTCRNNSLWMIGTGSTIHCQHTERGLLFLPLQNRGTCWGSSKTRKTHRSIMVMDSTFMHHPPESILPKKRVSFFFTSTAVAVVGLEIETASLGHSVLFILCALFCGKGVGTAKGRRKSDRSAGLTRDCKFR